jgi:phosphonoacetaldehyde hydrolase
MFKKDHIRTMAQMPRVSEAWREVHGRLPEEKDIEAMFHTFVPLQIECLPEHCEPVPGLGEAIESFRQSGLKVGSTTGYTSQMMEVVQPIARELGYAPDAVVAVDQVAAGRPSPWMALRNAELFDAWPLEACVKIGDTVADIREGLNASMWSIGVARTGNELGLSLEEERATDAQVLDAKLAEARERLLMAGAHYVVDSITDCPAILERISDRVRRGERP